MARCLPGKCPSSRRCRSRETRSRGPQSPAYTFQAIDQRHEPRKSRSPPQEFLQTQARRRSPQTLLRQGPFVRKPDQCRTNPKSGECAVERSFDSINFAQVIQALTRPRLPHRSAAPSPNPLRPASARCLLRSLPLHFHLAGSFLFPPRARVRDGKLVMSGRIVRQHSHVVLERANGFVITLGSIQRHAQSQKSLGKSRVQFARMREVRNGFAPLPAAPRYLAQGKLGGRAIWIDLQLFLKFFLGLFRVGRRIRFGKHHAPETKMDSWNVRVLRQNLLVLRRGVVPSVLRLHCLRVQFKSLIRGGRCRGQLLRSPCSQLPIVVSSDVENLRIVRKLAIQKEECCDRGLRLPKAHG